MQIDFHIAALGEIMAKLDERIAKVRSSLVIPKARVQDADRATVAGDESIAAETLMQPNGLKEPFGGGAVRGFPEQERAQGASPPLGVCD
jgi:hypothetical protein